MISSTSQLDIHNVIALFNQLVDVHTADILSIAQQSLDPTIMKDIDKDSVFDEDFDLPSPDNKDSDSNSSSSDIFEISNSAPDPIQSNLSFQFETSATSMFDDLTKLSNNPNSDTKNPFSTPSQVSESALNNESNLQLARDCRQLLQLEGVDTPKQTTFERPDGKGNYKFLVEKSIDTLTLSAKDRPLYPLLIESGGKIIESHACAQDALNISKSLKSLLNQSKHQQNTK